MHTIFVVLLLPLETHSMFVFEFLQGRHPIILEWVDDEKNRLQDVRRACEMLHQFFCRELRHCDELNVASSVADADDGFSSWATWNGREHRMFARECHPPAGSVFVENELD